MASYTFETITPSQALAFDQHADQLFFSSGDINAHTALVGFSAAGVAITERGHTVLFGPGVMGINTSTFASNSALLIGTGGNDSLQSSAGEDGLFGGAGDDRLIAGGGDDALNGGPGADTLIGGAGDDIFLFDPGESAATQSGMDVITDYQHEDRLSFDNLVGVGAGFASGTAATFDAALAFANQKIATGAVDVVAVQVGGDVIVFADDKNDNGVADDAVLLSNNTLDNVFPNSFVGTGHPTPTEASPLPPPPPVSPPVLPGGPPPPISPPPPADPGGIVEPTLPATPRFAGPGSPFTPGGANADITGNMDTAHISYALNAVITDADTTFVDAHVGDIGLRLEGSGFAVDSAGHLAGGIATLMDYNYGSAEGGPFDFFLPAMPPTPLLTLAGWALGDATQDMFSTLLAHDDLIMGALFHSDLIRGYGGNDFIEGGGGDDTIYGGLGNDVIFGNQRNTDLGNLNIGSTYLRGEEGDDYIVGGPAFDDINGNQGNDTLSGGKGDDWVVGGKDNDLQFGDDGNDIVWGNLGNDTLEGGAGNDQIRGGQGDDLIFGDAGDDFISGDRGNDTEVGGPGADIFHSFSGAGIDRVLDFHVSEGDKVMLDPGTKFQVSQVGADTVIDMGGGDQVILVGVQMSSLPPGTIFLG